MKRLLALAITLMVSTQFIGCDSMKKNLESGLDKNLAAGKKKAKEMIDKQKIKK